MLLKMRSKIPVLLICIILLSTTNVFAKGTNIPNFEMQKEKLLSTINISEEIDNALNGMTDESISEDIVNQVRIEAIFIPENSPRNNFVDIDSIDMFDTGYTLKKVGDIFSENGDINTMYALTAFATEKESNNSATETGVDSYITLVWIDNFGTNNKLVAVKGHWNPNRQIISDRYVGYGEGNGYSYYKYPTNNAFNYSTNLLGFSFLATANVEVAGYGRVGVSVKTSIFD